MALWVYGWSGFCDWLSGWQPRKELETLARWNLPNVTRFLPFQNDPVNHRAGAARLRVPIPSQEPLSAYCVFCTWSVKAEAFCWAFGPSVAQIDLRRWSHFYSQQATLDHRQSAFLDWCATFMQGRPSNHLSRFHFRGPYWSDAQRFSVFVEKGYQAFLGARVAILWDRIGSGISQQPICHVILKWMRILDLQMIKNWSPRAFHGCR